MFFAYLLTINASTVSADNGENICNNKSVSDSSSGSTDLGKMLKTKVKEAHSCELNCASIEFDGSSAYVTIDLGDVYNLKTIVFLTDIDSNVKNYATSTRTIGLSNDITDTTTNILIEEPDPSYMSMIYDAPEDGINTRFIHWAATREFKADEILCYSERRLITDELSGNDRGDKYMLLDKRIVFDPTSSDTTC